MLAVQRQFLLLKVSVNALREFIAFVSKTGSNYLCRQPPKPQPKSAAATKQTTNTSRGAKSARGSTRGRGNARNARPAKKTAEELDSEMVDYWQSGAATTEAEVSANGAAQQATNGDANMDDEILVSQFEHPFSRYLLTFKK
jgi:hypothetical protein